MEKVSNLNIAPAEEHSSAQTYEEKILNSLNLEQGSDDARRLSGFILNLLNNLEYSTLQERLSEGDDDIEALLLEYTKKISEIPNIDIQKKKDLSKETLAQLKELLSKD